jgi:y4mF family transcriptional regulator
MELATEIKTMRKAAGLTQAEVSKRAGVGLRFVRELEQGKPTVRLDKVKQVLNLLGYELCIRRKS